MAFIESGKSFDKKKNSSQMKKKLENMERVQIPLRLPVKIHRNLKSKTAQEGTTIQHVLMGFIEKYLSK